LIDINIKLAIMGEYKTICPYEELKRGLRNNGKTGCSID
jgi:hypothetical protein